MNSHIPKKSALIWIFCCLRATCSSLDSRFAKTNIKMGSFLQYIYMVKNGSSQLINFYVILGTITCTVYGFLTIFRFAVPIWLRKNQIWEFMILNSPRSGLQTRSSSNPQVCISLFSSLFRKSTFDIKCMIHRPAALSQIEPGGQSSCDIRLGARPSAPRPGCWKGSPRNG